MKKDRAAALIIKDGKVLMLCRHKPGEDVYMLPGGTLEEGETPEQAVVREVWEETSIESSFIRKIESFVCSNGRTHHTFEFKFISGIPHLQPNSPENIGTDKDTFFEALWVDTDLVKSLLVWPMEIKKYF